MTRRAPIRWWLLAGSLVALGASLFVFDGWRTSRDGSWRERRSR